MSTSPQKQNKNTYALDAESAAEMARLLDQDKLLTEQAGGLLPEQIDLSNTVDVLDIACGPGGWVHEMAREHPEMEVTGFDISKTMIEYARAHAQVRKLENAHFHVMNALEPLAFPNESFDLVNARAIVGFMPLQAWPTLIDECMRILRPGGIICLTEGEWGFSNKPAFERFCFLANQALHKAGQSFSPNGYHMGITPMLVPFLRQAGFQHIQKKAQVVDYSAGEPTHGGFYQNYTSLFTLAQPFLIGTGVITQEAFETLHQQALEEMQSDDFYALAFGLVVWGHKPSSVGA